jgi:hypothetical protein
MGALTKSIVRRGYEQYSHFGVSPGLLCGNLAHRRPLSHSYLRRAKPQRNKIGTDPHHAHRLAAGSGAGKGDFAASAGAKRGARGRDDSRAPYPLGVKPRRTLADVVSEPGFYISRFVKAVLK